MFNPKWCLLIFFIKVLIAAISLIHGAPIDLVPMPLNSSSGVEHFMNPSLEKNLNENHVESQTEAELIAINEDFEKEIRGNNTGLQKDLYNTTEQNEGNMSSNTPKEAIQEKISEIANSQIITENPQNTLGQGLVQNQPISELPTLDITSESVLMLTELKENESQNKPENPQNTLGQDSPQIQTTSEQPSSQITSESVLSSTEPKESDSQIINENAQNTQGLNLGQNQAISEQPMHESVLESVIKSTEHKEIDSQNKQENPQNTLGQDLPQILTTSEMPSSEITSEGVLSLTEPKEINSQIINENAQNTQQQNLAQNQAISVQPMHESASESVIKSIEPKEIDSQNKQENSQNTLGQHLPQILTTSEQPSLEITSESVLSLTEPKESDSQNKQENSQNTTEQNFTENLHSTEKQTITESEIIQEDSKPSLKNNSQIENENPQNNQSEYLKQITAQIREITNEENAQNENNQQKELSEESTTQTTTNAEQNSTKEINDSEIIKSKKEIPQNIMAQQENVQLREMKSFPIENENPQMNTNNNLDEMEKINEETSTQAANESVISTNISTDSEIVNSPNFKENPQNVPIDFNNENVHLNGGSSQQIYVEVREIGSEEEEIKNVNSQMNKENPQIIPIDLNNENLNIPIDLNKEDINLNGEASQQIYVEVREIPNQEEETQNTNSHISKENPESIQTEVNHENVNLYETPSQQIYVEVREIGSAEEEMQNPQNVAINENPEYSMATNEENKENIEVNDQRESANSSMASPSGNPQNVPINELSEKPNDLETTVKEVINELNENNKNTGNSQTNNEENVPAENVATQVIIKQMDLQNGEVSAITENNTENSKVNQELDKSILNGEISAVINLLNEDNETKLENSQIPTENNQNDQNTQINVAAELKSVKEEKPKTVESFTPSSQENNDSMNSQVITENAQNPLSMLNNTEMSTKPNFHITEVFTSSPSKDNMNTHISTENPQKVENNPTTETSVLNDTNMNVPKVHDTEESTQVSTENPQLVEIIPLSGHNEAENLTHLTTQEIEDKSKSENNFNFNSQMPTEDLQNAGVYMLMETPDTLRENGQEKSDAMDSQLPVTENTLNMTKDLKVEANAMDSQVLDTNTEKREEKSLMENITEGSVHDMEKVIDDIKTLPEEEKIAEESVINAQVTTKVDSDDSFENPGFITLTENTDMLVNNYQTTTMEADPREMEHLQSGNVVSEAAELQVTEEPAIFNDEQTTVKLDEVASKLEEIITNTSTEIPEMTSFNTKVMEETTSLPAEQYFPQSSEKNTNTLESLKIEESSETTIIQLTAAETSTTATYEDSTPPATAEHTNTEESPASPTTDSNLFDRATTHHQFASLLAETEMNVHKAFETIREWIANGKKLEKATKNPDVIEELSTTSNPTSNEFTTTEKSEENNTTILDTTTSGLSSSEENSTFAVKNAAEFSDTTTTSVLTTRPPSTESGFAANIKEATEEASVDTGTTEQVTESTEGLASIETTTHKVEEETTMEPTFARVQLQKDYTGINLVNLDDSSEEVSTEKKPIDALDQVESKNKEQPENTTANEDGMEKFTTPSELLELETSTQMPLATTTTFQGMVKFIKHEPTTTQRQDTQTELPLTQASFMEEKQQQIESTTVQEMSVPSTTSGEEEMSSMTTDATYESLITTTTTNSETDAAPQTTTDVLATTQEILSTTTDLSETTTDAPETTTTVAEEELTTTTELPEMDTTTLIVTVEPEPRSLPPPKLEYLQSEDGVEVFYGYSIVKHN